MKRFALRTLIASGLLLGFGAATSVGCVAPPAKTGAAATEGTFVTMDQVDDSMNDKVTGDRYQITYGKDDMWKGAPNGALVTIVEYSDFQCPYCSRLTNSLKQIAEEYPDDVRVVFKHLPLQMHQRAKPASEAVLAAHAQGKGWEMHDLVFENARQLSDEDLIKYAEQVGVPDMAKFKQDLEGHTYAAMIDADMKQGQQFGVSSTPSFFINGKPQRGTKSPEQLKQLIEEEKKAVQPLLDAGSKREEVYARIMKAAKTERAAPKRPDRGKGKGKQGARPVLRILTRFEHLNGAADVRLASLRQHVQDVRLAIHGPLRGQLPDRVEIILQVSDAATQDTFRDGIPGVLSCG